MLWQITIQREKLSWKPKKVICQSALKVRKQCGNLIIFPPRFFEKIPSNWLFHEFYCKLIWRRKIVRGENLRNYHTVESSRIFIGFFSWNQSFSFVDLVTEIGVCSLKFSTNIHSFCWWENFSTEALAIK